MIYNFVCEWCGEQVERRRDPCKGPPKTCSNVCRVQASKGKPKVKNGPPEPPNRFPPEMSLIERMLEVDSSR